MVNQLNEMTILTSRYCLSTFKLLQIHEFGLLPRGSGYGICRGSIFYVGSPDY